MISTHSLPDQKADLSANTRWNQFRYTLSLSFWKNRNVAITALMLMMVTLPLLFLLTEYNYYGDQVIQAYRAEDLFGHFTKLVFYSMLPISIIFVFISASQMFSYLHNRIALDVFHALPIKRTSLFAGRFVAGFLLVLIPQVITFASVLAISIIPDFRNINILAFAQTALTVFLLTLAVYAITCLAFTLTGTVLDAIFLLFLLNIAYPCTLGAIILLAGSILPGFPNNTFGTNINQFFYLSPIGQLFSAVFFPLNLFEWIWWIALTLVITAGGLLIFRQRKSEKAGLPYAYRTPFVILRFVGCFVVGSLFGMFFGSQNSNSLALVAGILIGSFTTHLIIEVMLSRGFSGFRRSLISYAIFLGLFTIGLLSLAYGFFGYDTRMPAQDQIIEAKIHAGDLQTVQLLDNSTVFPTFTDPENMAIVFEIQRAWLVEMQSQISKPYSLNIQNHLLAYGRGGFGQISYRLKSGEEFQRMVYFDPGKEPYAGLLKKLELTDEYALQLYVNFLETDNKSINLTFYTKSMDPVLVFGPDDNKKLQELQKALKADLLAGAQHQGKNAIGTLQAQSASDYSPIIYSSATTIKLTEGFTNTIAVLNKYNALQQAESLGEQYTSAYIAIDPTQSEYLNNVLNRYYGHDFYSFNEYYTNGSSDYPFLNNERAFVKVDDVNSVQSMLDDARSEWASGEKGYLVLFARDRQVGEDGSTKSSLIILFLPQDKLPTEVAELLNP